MYLSSKKEAQRDIKGICCTPKESTAIQLQNEHRDVRIQLKTNRTNGPIQCFPEESRTLKHEAKKIQDEIAALRTEMELLTVDSEFDEELWKLGDIYYPLKIMNEKMHHILPRNAIKKFIKKLNPNEKKEILLEFVKFTPTSDSDVTKEEYIQILQGDEKTINEMLPRILMSLRSNLTYGPANRSDDPKGKENDLDPNYLPSGELDDISKLYQIAFDAINQLDKDEDKDNRENLINIVRTSFHEAERILAERQGITGDDAYKYTVLEHGNPENWVYSVENNNWKKRRS